MTINVDKVHIHLNIVGSPAESIQKTSDAAKRLQEELDSLKRSLDRPSELYNQVKEAVAKLHDRLEEGPKKDVAGYVMSLFAIAEQDAGRKRGPKPPPEDDSIPAKASGQKAWETRRANEARRKELADGQSQ